VPGLLRRGVRRLRVELVWETRAETRGTMRTLPVLPPISATR
jgi:hypothetical protein